MSIFGKATSQIGPGDLNDLLDAAAIENVRLEFKREIPTKDETIKKLSSFSNTFGGWVVIGAQAAAPMDGSSPCRALIPHQAISRRLSPGALMP